jgi:hypothetical protein
MATPEYAEKADKLRDLAAKGSLDELSELVNANLDDVIWWINEGNNVSR